MTEHRIQIDHDKCIGCGMCIKDCVAHNIELKNDKAGVFSNNCIMCGHCVATVSYTHLDVYKRQVFYTH